MTNKEYNIEDIYQFPNHSNTGNLPEIPKDFLEFNKLIGWPQHPQTFKEHPLTKVQVQFYKKYIHPTKQIKIHLNKARQDGWTELILRIFAHQSFFKYKGKKIIIIPGTREKTTKDIFNRFVALFKNITECIEEIGPLYMKIVGGTEVFGMPANQYP